MDAKILFSFENMGKQCINTNREASNTPLTFCHIPIELMLIIK